MRLFAWGPVAAPVVFTVPATIATALTPGHDPLRDAVSLLAGPGTPYPWLLNGSIIAYAILVQGLGPSLHRAAGGGRWGGALWALVACYGLGGLGAGIWRDAYTDGGWWLIDQNAMHDNAARIAFGAVLGLCALAPLALRHRSGWAGWARFSWAMAALSALAAVLFEMRVWPSIHGFFELCFFATTMAWVFVTGLRLRKG
ncbi:MAG: DUF998 domain-containing protein [Chloroflexota bacterium]